jgi:hypothetical protein
MSVEERAETMMRGITQVMLEFGSPRPIPDKSWFVEHIRSAAKARDEDWKRGLKVLDKHYDGSLPFTDGWGQWGMRFINRLVSTNERAAARAERERCAKVVEGLVVHTPNEKVSVGRRAAKAIRALPDDGPAS